MATLPDPAPTKAGHSLVHWYKVTGETGQEDVAYNFSTTVSANMTLKAKWYELQNDPSLSALTYDGNEINVTGGVEIDDVINEGLIKSSVDINDDLTIEKNSAFVDNLIKKAISKRLDQFYFISILNKINVKSSLDTKY